MTDLTPKQKLIFHTLVNGVGSAGQLTRIRARLNLSAFVEKHGKEACDKAFAEETVRLEKRAARLDKKAKHLKRVTKKLKKKRSE